MKDPYEILGVSKTASEADIKKAFRTLAKKHHPDKHAGDATAQKRFQEISGAYDILGDKDKRAQFDAGAIGPDGNPRGFDPRQGHGAGGFHPAMARHSRACMPSVRPGNSRRDATAAGSSPCCSNVVRIVATSASETE